MTKTFTQDDLIRYYYQETTELETKEINEALLVDSELNEEFLALKDVITRLDDVKKAPSKRIIENIISYSKSFNLHSANKG